MASMTYCMAQNCLSDLRQIITKVKENKSFSQDEASALIDILDESLELMEILDVDVNVFFENGKSFRSIVEAYNNKAKLGKE